MCNHPHACRDRNSRRSALRSGCCLFRVYGEQRAYSSPLAGFPGDSLSSERVEDTTETVLLWLQSAQSLLSCKWHGVSVCVLGGGGRSAYIWMNVKYHLFVRAIPCELVSWCLAGAGGTGTAWTPWVRYALGQAFSIAMKSSMTTESLCSLAEGTTRLVKRFTSIPWPYTYDAEALGGVLHFSSTIPASSFLFNPRPRFPNPTLLISAQLHVSICMSFLWWDRCFSPPSLENTD